jgi:putative FmdB family regulatory protein
LYPYRCTQCGHRFEKIQHFNSEPEKVCPECGGALERILTAPGLSFKGAGWYVNDYAAKGSSSSGDSDSKSEKKSDGKSETKSETKPDTKSETKSPAADKSNAATTSSTPAAAPKPTPNS